MRTPGCRCAAPCGVRHCDWAYVPVAEEGRRDVFPWGEPEKGVFTDRTKEDIEYIDAIGDRFWWLIVVPGACWTLQYAFHLQVMLRVLYFFLWFGFASTTWWKERRS